MVRRRKDKKDTEVDFGIQREADSKTKHNRYVQRKIFVYTQQRTEKVEYK